MATTERTLEDWKNYFKESVADYVTELVGTAPAAGTSEAKDLDSKKRFLAELTAPTVLSTSESNTGMFVVAVIVASRADMRYASSIGITSIGQLFARIVSEFHSGMDAYKAKAYEAFMEFFKTYVADFEEGIHDVSIDNVQSICEVLKLATVYQGGQTKDALEYISLLSDDVFKDHIISGGSTTFLSLSDGSSAENFNGVFQAIFDAQRVHSSAVRP